MFVLQCLNVTIIINVIIIILSDSEQTDDTYISNNTDFAGSEMVLPRLRKVVVSSQPFYSHFEDVSIQKVEKENISTAKNSNGKNAKKNSEVFPKSNSGKKLVVI